MKRSEENLFGCTRQVMRLVIARPKKRPRPLPSRGECTRIFALGSTRPRVSRVLARSARTQWALFFQHVRLQLSLSWFKAENQKSSLAGAFASAFLLSPFEQTQHRAPVLSSGHSPTMPLSTTQSTPRPAPETHTPASAARLPADGFFPMCGGVLHHHRTDDPALPHVHVSVRIGPLAVRSSGEVIHVGDVAWKLGARCVCASCAISNEAGGSRFLVPPGARV